MHARKCARLLGSSARTCSAAQLPNLEARGKQIRPSRPWNTSEKLLSSRIGGLQRGGVTVLRSSKIEPHEHQLGCGLHGPGRQNEERRQLPQKAGQDSKRACGACAISS